MSSNIAGFYRQLIWEFRLQQRYYFWTIAMVLSLVWLILLYGLSNDVRARWLPVLVFADLSNIGLLFIAGILYLEKRQGTLYALAITPVRRGRWLLLKLTSLGLLTTVCALVIVFVSATAVDWRLLIPATVLTAVLFTLCGFLLALPFDQLLNYFLGMALTLIVLSLPILGYFEVYSHWLYWLLPTQPILMALAGSFHSMDLSRYLLCLMASCLWVAILYGVSVRQFRRFIAMRPQS